MFGTIAVMSTWVGKRAGNGAMRIAGCVRDFVYDWFGAWCFLPPFLRIEARRNIAARVSPSRAAPPGPWSALHALARNRDHAIRRFRSLACRARGQLHHDVGRIREVRLGDRPGQTKPVDRRHRLVLGRRAGQVSIRDHSRSPAPDVVRPFFTSPRSVIVTSQSPPGGTRVIVINTAPLLLA